MTCETFEASMEELAVGALGEPVRSGLLTHASGCLRCQSSLDQLSVLVDRLLLLAPEHDPPAGFENRVLTALERPHADRRHRRVPRRFAAAAAAVVIIGVGGLALAAARTSGSTAENERSGILLASTGEVQLGRVELVREPAPHVLVTIDHPRRGGGTVSCELELAGGRRVVVGEWDYDVIAAGVWAVGIDHQLLDAMAMRVLAGDGTVVATATFDAPRA